MVLNYYKPSMHCSQTTKIGKLSSLLDFIYIYLHPTNYLVHIKRNLSTEIHGYLAIILTSCIRILFRYIVHQYAKQLFLGCQAQPYNSSNIIHFSKSIVITLLRDIAIPLFTLTQPLQLDRHILLLPTHTLCIPNQNTLFQIDLCTLATISSTSSHFLINANYYTTNLICI